MKFTDIDQNNLELYSATPNYNIKFLNFELDRNDTNESISVLLPKNLKIEDSSEINNWLTPLKSSVYNFTESEKLISDFLLLCPPVLEMMDSARYKETRYLIFENALSEFSSPALQRKVKRNLNIVDSEKMELLHNLSSNILLEPNIYYRAVDRIQEDLNIELKYSDDNSIVDKYIIEFYRPYGKVTFPNNLFWEKPLPENTNDGIYVVTIINKLASYKVYPKTKPLDFYITLDEYKTLSWGVNNSNASITYRIGELVIVEPLLTYYDRTIYNVDEIINVSLLGDLDYNYIIASLPIDIMRLGRTAYHYLKNLNLAGVINLENRITVNGEPSKFAYTLDSNSKETDLSDDIAKFSINCDYELLEDGSVKEVPSDKKLFTIKFLEAGELKLEAFYYKDGNKQVKPIAYSLNGSEWQYALSENGYCVEFKTGDIVRLASSGSEWGLHYTTNLESSGKKVIYGNAHSIQREPFWLMYVPNAPAYFPIINEGSYTTILLLDRSDIIDMSNLNISVGDVQISKINSITTSPIIIGKGNCLTTFQDCPNLQEVYYNTTQNPDKAWLRNVAENGILYKKISPGMEFNSENGVPENWEVEYTDVSYTTSLWDLYSIANGSSLNIQLAYGSGYVSVNKGSTKNISYKLVGCKPSNSLNVNIYLEGKSSIRNVWWEEDTSAEDFLKSQKFFVDYGDKPTIVINYWEGIIDDGDYYMYYY